MTISYHNGIGGSTGDSLATTSPLTVSGNIWYVSSATGTDAASPAGKNREKPLATLAQAVTNSADDDIVVFLDGHAETLTAAQTINKRLVFVGEGSDSGNPTVEFTNNQAAAVMFTVSADSVVFRNIQFNSNAQACSAVLINVTGADVGFIGCRWECGQYDDNYNLAIEAADCFLTDCTFISVATVTTAQPYCALGSGTANFGELTLDGCVFSSGTVGFSNIYALDLSNSGASQIRASNISLLLGADVKLHASMTGYFGATTVTGGSRVDW